MKHFTLTAALLLMLCTANSQNMGIGTSSPGSKLTVNGSFAANYRIESSASATIGANDFYIAYNGSGGTLTLPAAATTTLGRTYHIKNTSSAVLTVSSAAANQIDNQSGAGVTSFTLSSGYYAVLISKGTTSGTTWELALVGNASVADPSIDAFINNAANTRVELGTNSDNTTARTAGTEFVIKDDGKTGIGTSSPSSKLTVNGSFAAPYKIVTASGAVGANDFYTAYNSASAGTLTLPAATAAAPAVGNILGRMYHFKNTSTGVLTVAASGTELIDNQSGAGVASVTINPGYYALVISKGTTGATTTWEVALVASANEGAKPQMVVIETSAGATIARGGAGSTTALNNDVVKVNTIPGATYTASSGATAGFVTLPAGTYLINMTIEGDCSGAANSSFTSDGLKPNHSFFYDFQIDPNTFRRIHSNTVTNLGSLSNFGLQIQYTTTISAARNFPFQLGWGQGGNVNTNVNYGISHGTPAKHT